MNGKYLNYLINAMFIFEDPCVLDFLPMHQRFRVQQVLGLVPCCRYLFYVVQNIVQIFGMNSKLNFTA